MRLFIAIELPASMKTELTRLQKEVKQVSCGGRFVSHDNFHITLHFIGESDDLMGAVSAMQNAVRGIRPFGLHLGKYDSFNKGGSHTSFIRVEGELNELNILHEALQTGLCDNGFSCDTKRYAPHITLGRNVEYDELSETELYRLTPNASMTVMNITLFESVRERGGMVYRPLHRERFYVG